MAPAFRRRQNRLLLEVYEGARVYSLTLACAERRPVFGGRSIVDRCIDVLRSCSEKHEFAVLAYCFMPDHLHLLVEGGSGSSLPRFVKDFKQRTGYAYRRTSTKVLWQKSYYDHVLRREENVRHVARYVVGNAVRAGLAEAPADYPYSGSFVWHKAIMEA
jgi:putative transposase